MNEAMELFGGGKWVVYLLTELVKRGLSAITERLPPGIAAVINPSAEITGYDSQFCFLSS